MQATFQTKIRDEGVYPVLDAQAALSGRLMRRLFRDLYVLGREPSECKKLYIARYGITARQFNPDFARSCLGEGLGALFKHMEVL